MFETGLANLFFAFFVLVVAAIAFILWRYLARRQLLIGLAVLALWITYGAVFGLSGVMTHTSPAVVVLPVLVALLLLMNLAPAGRVIVSQVPVAALIGLETFRVGVELTLHALWSEGLIPRLMTLEGGNVEIIVAAVAPIVAWLSTRGPGGRRVAFIWNIAGVLSLANVVTRAVLTSPGPLHLILSDTPAIGIGMLPFTFIPAFMVPLALTTHVLVFKSLKKGVHGPAE